MTEETKRASWFTFDLAFRLGVMLGVALLVLWTRQVPELERSVEHLTQQVDHVQTQTEEARDTVEDNKQRIRQQTEQTSETQRILEQLRPLFQDVVHRQYAILDRHLVTLNTLERLTKLLEGYPALFDGLTQRQEAILRDHQEVQVRRQALANALTALTQTLQQHDQTLTQLREGMATLLQHQGEGTQ